MLRQSLIVAATLSVAQGAPDGKVTPIQKVITLLEDLKAEVEGEGKTEAASYDKFSCFCKDTTEAKSEAIKKGQDEIDSLSAEIGDKTAQVSEAETEMAERKERKAKLEAELA